LKCYLGGRGFSIFAALGKEKPTNQTAKTTLIYPITMPAGTGMIETLGN